MLGFVIIDHQPSATQTAVWLTSRVADARTNHTNAIVLGQSCEGYTGMVTSLAADRVVVFTPGTEPPMDFANPLNLDIFDDLIAETLRHQERIDAAVEFARTHKFDEEGNTLNIRKRDLVDPAFPRRAPALAEPEPDDAPHRALATANYVARCWEYWLKTDEQRVFRTVNAKTGKPPGLMPPGLDDRVVAEFPPKFAQRVQLEPLPKRAVS